MHKMEIKPKSNCSAQAILNLITNQPMHVLVSMGMETKDVTRPQEITI